MTINLPSPINLIRPHHIEFGFGAVPITGRWVLAKGFTRDWWLLMAPTAS